MEPTAPTTAAEPRPVRRLTRSRDGRWFGGVCSGLGRYFDVSPAIYRLAFAALALAGGTGVLLYLAAWLVIPDDGEESSLAETALREHRNRPGLAVGVGLIGLAAIIVFSHAAFWPHPGNIWLAALLVGGGLVWWELHGRQPAAAVGPAPGAQPAGGEPAGETTVTGAAPPPRPPAQSLFLPGVGGLLAVAGVLGLLEALDAASVDWRLVLGGAVVAVGAAIVAGALTGRRVVGLAGLGLLLLPVFLLSLAIHVPLRGGIGDRVERPGLTAGATQEHRLAIGDLTLDLRDAAVPVGTTTVRATVGLGQLTVEVPEGVALAVTGKARAGEVQLFGSRENGFRVERHLDEGAGPRRLVLDLEVGVGDIEVRH
jgi:phage shock protein PspC (stress-responsive transcriptional regulator)